MILQLPSNYPPITQNTRNRDSKVEENRESDNLKAQLFGAFYMGNYSGITGIIAVSLLTLGYQLSCSAQDSTGYVGPSRLLGAAKVAMDSTSTRGGTINIAPGQTNGQCYTDQNGYYHRFEPSNPPRGGSGQSGFFIEQCAQTCYNDGTGQRKFDPSNPPRGSGQGGFQITPCN